MGGTNGGLTTLESAAAFAIFGNGGIYFEPTFYTKVTDQEGKTVLDGVSKPQMAISEDTATIMNHLLQTVVYGANGTGKSAASFIPNMKIYAKTGTSNNANDLWFVGGSPYYVASCWAGFETQQPVSNSATARKLWGAVMSKLHSGLSVKTFEDSSYATEKYYCTATGNLATSACPSTAVGWYKKNKLPATCSAHAGELLPEPGTEPATDTPTEQPATDGEATPTE